MSKTLIAIAIILVAVSSTAYYVSRARKSVEVTQMTPDTAVSVTDGAEVQEQSVPPVTLSKEEKTIRRDIPTQVAELNAETSSLSSQTPSGTTGEVASAESATLATPALEEKVAAEPTGDVDASITVAQMTGVNTDSRAVTEFLLGVKYEIDRNNTVGIIQEARKLYEVSIGEDEFLLQDTAIYYQCRLGKGLLDTDWTLHAGVTLPVSRESRDNMMVTRPSVGFEISRRFLNDRVRVSLQPFFHYYFNEYATNLQRTPLRKMSLGQQLEVDVAVIPGRMNFVVWGKGYYNVSEEFDDSATSPAPTTSLEYGSYLGLGLNKHLGAQVGYVKGNSIFKDPILNGSSSLMDPAASRVYAALEFTF